MQELKNEFTTDYDVDDSDDIYWFLSAKGYSVTIPAGKKEIVKTAKFVDDLGSKTHSYPISNIKKFKRSDIEPKEQYKSLDNIVSTEDSETEIYMWNEDDTIYWYSEAKNPKLPTNSKGIFGGFQELEDASGVNDFDTSEVTNISMFFQPCTKLTSLNLSNWDTKNVTDMSYLFCRMSQFRKY